MKIEDFLKARAFKKRLTCEVCRKELLAKNLNYTLEKKVLCDKCLTK